MVPGPLGSPQLAIVHGGEEVITPAQRRGGGATSIHIHIDQGAYIDGPSIDILANRIANRLGYASGR